MAMLVFLEIQFKKKTNLPTHARINIAYTKRRVTITTTWTRTPCGVCVYSFARKCLNCCPVPKSFSNLSFIRVLCKMFLNYLITPPQGSRRRATEWRLNEPGSLASRCVLYHHIYYSYGDPPPQILSVTDIDKGAIFKTDDFTDAPYTRRNLSNVRPGHSFMTLCLQNSVHNSIRCTFDTYYKYLNIKKYSFSTRHGR